MKPEKMSDEAWRKSPIRIARLYAKYNKQLQAHLESKKDKAS
jgi:hypothetical protein